MQNPVVSIRMKNGKVIKIELYPDVAPNTVNNFIYLVKRGFYDDLTFHRVIRGFMIQGGDPNGTGTGGPRYRIKGEFSANGVKNDLKHTRGVVSMARSRHPDSAGSQFFIMHGDAPHLDGQESDRGDGRGGRDRLRLRRLRGPPAGRAGDEKGYRGNFRHGVSRTGKTVNERGAPRRPFLPLRRQGR